MMPAYTRSALIISLHRHKFCRFNLPFPLPFSGFFGSLGFFFPKKNPKRSARRSLAYALFPMPGRGARSPANNVSLRGVGQRPTYTFSFMSEREAEPRIYSHSPRYRGAGLYAVLLLRKARTDKHFVALPCHIPLTPVRFFRVSGTFSQKSPRVGHGAKPHI